MKVIGKMICNMVPDMKSGRMDHHILVLIHLAKSKELDFTNGMMDLNMEVNGKKIKSMVL